jgi:arylsulfatase A-like enzyme
MKGVFALLKVCAAATAPPNIVFMLADELGWNNVGWQNGSIALTPNLDKLAAGGVKLTQHYVQRWCAPTRTAVMTGRYPYNTGMMKYGHGLSEELSAVPSAFEFVPAMLKKHAPIPYQTHHLGKW